MENRRSTTAHRGPSAYDAPGHERAYRVGPAVLAVRGTGLRAKARRIPAGLLALMRYSWGLPRLRIEPSDTPAGRLIRQHLMFRRDGRLKYAYAQGVLLLPETFSEYLRGRRRQALRTNLAHARRRGMHVTCEPIDEWAPGTPDGRFGALSPGPAERWVVWSADGRWIGEAILTVDDRYALLQGMVAIESYARWILHTAIVESLCGRCEVLLTNSEDIPLMSEGARHFQRLLGYSAARLCLRRSVREILEAPPVYAGTLCVGGAAVIVGAHFALPHGSSWGERSLVWLTVLVTVRIASRQAGPAALTGALSAATFALIGGIHHPVILAYLLAGGLLDLQLALIPRLTWNAVGVAVAAVLVMIATITAAPGLPGMGGHASPPGVPVPPVLAAVVFGAVAATLGWTVGKLLAPRSGLRTAPA